MENKRNAGVPWIAVIVVVAILCVGAYFLASSIVGARSSVLSTTIPTSAYAGYEVKPLGEGILYSDGAMLHALDGRGRQIWPYAAGAGSQFSVGSGGVATWVNTMFSWLTNDGEVLFSGNLDGNILDARVGSMYAAVQIGEEHNSTMVILETDGREVERVTLKDQTVLDFGFFNNDTLLWLLSLNTEGTVPICSISTYRPGRTLINSVPDTEQVFYELVFGANKVRAVGTTYIKDYEYTGGKELTDDRILVYGWYLMGLDDKSANPLMAFVPVDQSDGSTGINDLRMIRGQMDQRVRLPFPAMRVLVLDDATYAFSNQYVMITHLGETTPTVYTLPIYVEGVLGITQDKKAIITSGGVVYMVPMP